VIEHMHAFGFHSNLLRCQKYVWQRRGGWYLGSIPFVQYLFDTYNLLWNSAGQMAIVPDRYGQVSQGNALQWSQQIGRHKERMYTCYVIMFFSFVV